MMRAPALQPGAAECVGDHARRVAHDDAGLQTQRQPVAEIAGPGLEIIGIAQVVLQRGDMGVERAMPAAAAQRII